MNLTIFSCEGIAAANTSHVQYFDGEDSRVKNANFYAQLVRVKDFAVLPFADDAQQLLVKYTREDLEQLRAANWYEGQWMGPHGRYCLAHAGYAGSNNNMGIEVDWRDTKGECPQSATIGTFTGSLFALIDHLGQEHCVFISKLVSNLLPAKLSLNSTSQKGYSTSCSLFITKL